MKRERLEDLKFMATGCNPIGTFAIARRLLVLALSAVMLALPTMLASANAAAVVIPLGQASTPQAAAGDVEQEHCAQTPIRQEKECAVHCLDWGMPAPVKLSRSIKFDQGHAATARLAQSSMHGYLAHAPPLADQRKQAPASIHPGGTATPIFASTCRYRL